MKTMQVLNTIFTFKMSNPEDAQKVKLCFSEYIDNTTSDNNLVFNISCNPEELLKLSNKMLDKIIFSSTSIFNIYLYYPTSGFRVFNIKEENENQVNQNDFDLFKKHVAKYI